jgi:VWFA-related protein
LAAILNMSTVAEPVALAQQPASVPDAPTPQPRQPLSDASGSPITPGKGEGNGPVPDSSTSETSAAPGAASSQPPSDQGKDTFQTAPPQMPGAGEGFDETATRLRIEVNFVEVPVTVKDNRGNLVAGLTWRDFKVFENDRRVPLSFFTVDSFPLSIAFVIDQSLPSPVMSKVNDSLGSIQGALTPYDELAVFSYNNGAQERTGFTGAQSPRVPFVMAMTKEAGSDPLVPVNDGPFSSCNIRVNGNCSDPNLQEGRSAGNGTFITIPKEIHTLNDAILAAAKELSTRPKGRRRILYVISDGKEAGSKANIKEVLKYLETNKIAVYGTAVGDSARWGEGFISRIHIPLTMYDNVLYKYTAATGGELVSERDRNGIEKSYAKIAEEARASYTLGYNSHEPILDGKFRKIEVRVDRPGVEVIAKRGYLPSGREPRPVWGWCRPPPGAVRTSWVDWARVALRLYCWSSPGSFSPCWYCWRYAPDGGFPSPGCGLWCMPHWPVLNARWRWLSFIARWPWARWA